MACHHLVISECLGMQAQQVQEIVQIKKVVQLLRVIRVSHYCTL